MSTGTTATTGTPYADATLGGLLAVPRAERDDTWLHGALQAAVDLELATIPPYLCALWSIKDPEAPPSAMAARRLRAVALDGMYRLAVACNLVAAIGRRPLLRTRAPDYPGPLPRGRVPGLVVHLQGLTRGLVGDVLLAIEHPDGPPARSSDTVGLFYEALIEQFGSYRGPLLTDRQRELSFGGRALTPVRSPEQAVQVIAEAQRAGAAGEPLSDEPAHYYRLGELAHGHRLVRIGPGGEWAWAGQEVPFPEWRTDVFPMAQLPAGGWPRPLPEPVERPLRRFNRAYTDVLDGLEHAWDGDGPALFEAIEAMQRLAEPARELMRLPYAGGEYTYGPDFRALP